MSDQDAENFDTSVFKIRTSLEFPVSENGRLQLSLFGESSEMSDVDPNNVAVSPLIHNDVAMGRQTGGGLGFAYTWDTRRTARGARV